MEIGVLIVVGIGLFLGFLVLQGTFAARAWRERIAAGDLGVLRQALDDAFESWREIRPPKGMPSADWAALASAELVAADRDRARASLVADADVRVVAGERRELAGPLTVGRRVALRMAERLFYEIPHVRFEEVQIDVSERYRDAGGAVRARALLTTRATREQASAVDWSVQWEFDPLHPPVPAVEEAERAETTAAPGRAPDIDPAAILARWRTREAVAGPDLDLELGALIESGEGINLGAPASGAGAMLSEGNGMRPDAGADPLRPVAAVDRDRPR